MQPSIGGLPNHQEKIDAGRQMAKCRQHPTTNENFKSISRSGSSMPVPKDKERYKDYMQQIIQQNKGITVLECEIKELCIENNKILGLKQQLTS